MAYISKEWITGETITAEKLNNLEEGVQEALESSDEYLMEIVNIEARSQDGSTWDVTTNKTAQEIMDLVEDGKIVVANVHVIPYSQPDWYWQQTPQTVSNGYGHWIEFIRPWIIFQNSHQIHSEIISISDSGATFEMKEFNYS